MTYLTRMDLALGGLMERLFCLRRRFQPSDLARLLTRAVLANERKTLATTCVPNCYLIEMAPGDLARLEPIRPEVEKDLFQVLSDLVAGQDLEALGPLSVELQPVVGLLPGRVRVRAAFSLEA